MQNFINYVVASVGNSKGFRRFAVLVLGVVGLCSCVTTDDSSSSSSSSGGVIDGKRLYMKRCAQCHTLTPVNEYNWSDWQPIMDDMAKRSKFNPEQKAAVMAYVKANCL